MYSDINSDGNSADSIAVSISPYQLEVLKNKLNSFKVSIFLQFIGENSHLVQQIYLDYKIGMINKLVCLILLMTSIPLWLLRTPSYSGSNALFSLAWLFYILGFGIPVIILLLKIPDNSKYVIDLSKDPNNNSSDNILIQRTQFILSILSPLASGFPLLGRTLAGECSFDNIQLINSNKCNPENNSFAIPQEQVFFVGVFPILISIVFKTPIHYTVISLIECTVFIAVSTLYTKSYNSVWTLIIAASLPTLILYEYEREQLNIFLSLLRSCCEFNNVKVTSSDDGNVRDKKSVNNARENVKEGPFLEMIKVATDKMLESFRSELSREFAYNQENFQNLETLTINSLGSAAFSERRRHYINDNMHVNDNYSDFSEALESKSVESIVESVSECNAAMIPEPTSTTQEDATYRAAYMRSLAVGKILDFIPADGQFSKYNIDDMGGKTKIDRLLITHRNLVVELENIKNATTVETEGFWQRIDDFLLELDKYRTEIEVERQLLDYMTRSANNFRNRK